MKAAPLVAAHEEGLEPVEGDEEARQAEGLLGAGEQEILLTAQRGRQGFSTGPVQFGSQEQTFSHVPLPEGEAQGRLPWRGPLWHGCWERAQASRSSPAQRRVQGPSARQSPGCEKRSTRGSTSS